MFISSKVCLLTSIEDKRQTLPEIDVHARTSIRYTRVPHNGAVQWSKKNLWNEVHILYHISQTIHEFYERAESNTVATEYTV